MKSVLKPDHIAVNNYVLSVVGLPVALTPTEVSGLEEELEIAELPDRTKASGGYTKATEFEIQLPMHHKLEQAAMETWFTASQEPVSLPYKFAAILQHKSGTGTIRATYSLVGVFPTKRALPDLEMANEGEMATVTWTLSVDQILPIS